MTPETFKDLTIVVAALVVVGCIASIFGFTLRRPKAVRAERTPLPDTSEGAAEPEATRPPVDQALFRETAGEKLEPLLAAVVDRARAHQCEARYEVLGEAEATRYRLEVKRPDHPAGQPVPYISFAAGEHDHVEMVYGGMFPGPSDHNRADTEIGWRTIRWDQVDDVLATFTHKVFAHFD
ncbi:hypothetical protein [Caulobacter sp.]|uniref:hypothetical protein n=1 Tax=Caulobacter sp. TaxID=78 RepID=UPI002B471A1D|nr:hypothetical protein [Caulobacter sp.]HJV43871.1 hypothetical protein [Caulobacter sp.]